MNATIKQTQSETSASHSQMPKGIPYIIGNEAAERLSYYGMLSILTIYLANHLNLGAQTASTWVHFFGVGVYFFPIIGAIISDVFLGKYKTIIGLSLVYCLGHMALALFEGSVGGVILGLTLIAIGAGGIKPCVSAHVGDQFNKTNSHLIEKVYSLFYLSINLGGLIGMILCPFLLESYGAAVAFGIPGVLMGIATLVFWLGRNRYTIIAPSKQQLWTELKSPAGKKALLSVVTIYLFLAFFWALFEQTKTTFVIQAADVFMNKQLHFFGLLAEPINLLPSQVQSANPFFILVFTPLFSFLVYPFLSKFFTVTPLKKIGIGFGLAICSFLIVGWTEGFLQAGEERSIGWLILAYGVMTGAEVMVSITALELSYRYSPNTLKSIVMGLFLLSVSVGNGIAALILQVTTQTVVVENVIGNRASTLQLADLSGIETGDKINLKNAGTLKADGTITSGGTYLIGDLDATSSMVQLWDVKTGKPIDLAVEPNKPIEATRYLLSGSHYFYFFALLLLVVTIVFAVVARFIQMKTYVQG